MVEDRVQDLDSYKKTVETFLNELFLLDDQVTNEMKMRWYADEIGVKISV